MSFEIKQPMAVTLKSVTIRSERHGDDDVTAITIGLKATVPNTFMDALDPNLRQALYQPVPDQEQLPGVEPSTPLLRTRSIDTLHLKQSFDGWTLEIAHGIDEADPIKLGGCKCDKWVATPKEGGSVELAFRVGSNDIDATEIGQIGAKLAQEISIRLLAPVKAEPAIDGSQAAFDADHPEAGAADPTDLFTQQHGDRGEDEGSPLTSDDMDGPDDADSEGGEPDVDQDDAAAFEAGLQHQIDAKGLKPKRRAPAVNDGGKRKRA